jgi:hypothetical protein
VLRSICVFKSSIICLMRLDAPTLGTCKNFYFFLMYCFFYLREVTFFVSSNKCRFEVYIIRYCYSCLFGGALSLINFPLPCHFQPMFVSLCNLVSCKKLTFRTFI